MNICNKQSFGFLTGLLIVILYLTPYFFLGSKILIPVGEELDSIIVNYKTVAESPHYWCFNSQCIADEILSGQAPRATLPAPLKITSLLFYFFHPISAYIINKAFVHFIGLIGMFLFLSTYIIKDDRYLLSGIISAAFAILPHPTIYEGATFVIAPLVFYAFLRILKSQGKQAVPFSVLFLSPFFASFVLVNFFLGVTLSILMIIYSIKIRKLQSSSFIALAIFTCGAIIADLPMMLLILTDSGFTSHRVLRVVEGISFFQFLKGILHYLTAEKYDMVAPLQRYILFLYTPITVYAIIKKKYFPILLFSVALIVNFSLASFIKLSCFEIFRNNFDILRAFDLKRFTYLNPFYFWALFGSLLSSISGYIFINKKRIPLYPIPIFLALFSILYVVKNSWGYRLNIERVLNGDASIIQWDKNMQNFNTFYSPALFHDIREFLKDDTVNFTISLGLHPAVPRYNGFKTVDAYFDLCPLQHHDRFIKLLEPELPFLGSQKDKLKTWGNRLYLFNGESLKFWDHKGALLHKNLSQSKNPLVLRINPQILDELSCTHLLSTLPIQNDILLSLKLLKTFERADSPYRIFLYRYDSAGHH